MIGLLLAAVLLAVASYRVWRMLGKDKISERLRLWLFDNEDRRGVSFVADLIICPWCLGWWVNVVGGISLGLLYEWHPLEIVLVVCAASSLTGLLAGLEE